MTIRPPLAVWLDGRRVAVLNDAGGSASLSYTPEALDTFGLDRPVLSVSVPTRPDYYPGVAASPFLDGLLPEDWARDRIAQIARLDRSDTFGLLEAFGRDCAGAVSILADEAGTPSDEVGVEWLDDDSLLAAVRNLPVNPFADDPGRGVRVSLGGVQEKLAVVMDGDRVGLPLGTTPSTHILKPAPLDQDGQERWPGLAQVEVFCLKLAAAVAQSPAPRARVRGVGFGAARADLIQIGRRPAVCVARYDRREVDGVTRRVHQEDGCQALGLAPDRKYQKRAGELPSLAALAAALDRWGVDAALDKRALLQFVAFTVLVGNADLHAKNISLLDHPSVRLAPMYDVVNTLSYQGIDAELGLRIGTATEINEATGAELISEAATWGVGHRAAGSALSTLASGLLQHVDEVLAEPSLTHPAVDATASRVRERAQALLDELRHG